MVIPSNRAPKDRLIKVASFQVIASTISSFEHRLESKNFFKVSREINENNFPTEVRYSKRIELNFFSPPDKLNMMMSTNEVEFLIKLENHRFAHLEEILALSEDDLEQIKDFICLSFGRQASIEGIPMAPGIRHENNMLLLSLYGLSSFWRFKHCFAAVPNKYFYPPLF